MTIEWVHPGLLLIAGAWILPFLRGQLKRAAMLFLPAAALIDCLFMIPGTYGVTNFLGQELTFGRVDGLTILRPGADGSRQIVTWMAVVGIDLHLDRSTVAILAKPGNGLQLWMRT